MKRFRRWLFNFAAALSLLLGALTFVAMIVSVYADLYLDVQRRPEGNRPFANGRRDIVRISAQWHIAAKRGSGSIGMFDFGSQNASTGSGGLHIPLSPYWVKFYASAEPSPDFELWTFGFNYDHSSLGSSKSLITTGQVQFPLCSLVVLLLILPTVWMSRPRPQTRGQRECLCLVCGYDLRATPERCPECGNVPTVSS